MCERIPMRQSEIVEFLGQRRRLDYVKLGKKTVGVIRPRGVLVFDLKDDVMFNAWWNVINLKTERENLINKELKVCYNLFGPIW